MGIDEVILNVFECMQLQCLQKGPHADQTAEMGSFREAIFVK